MYISLRPFKNIKFKQMKKITIIFLTIVSSGLFFSCNDELDLPSDGRIGLDEIFTDYNRTRGYLNSAYGYVPDPRIHRSSYTDEAQDARSILPGSDTRAWYEGNVTAENFAGISPDGSPWGRLYEGIRKCNIFLANIETATDLISDEERVSWTAQARTLRALYYLQLIKRYGGVPIIDEPLGVDHDYSQDTRATFSEVVTFILEDCNKALEAPANSTAEAFSWEIYANQFQIMTRAVAYAVKSQAVTYAASPLWGDGTYTWEDATEITAEALAQCLANGYKLFDEEPAAGYAHNAYALYFLTNSNDQRTRDKETIYQAGNQLAIWRDAGLPTNPGMNSAGPNPTQELVDSYEMANGEAPISGYADANHLDPVINPASGYNPDNPYAGRDPRFYASIYYNGAVRYLDQPGSVAAMKFTATAPFYAINALSPSWGNSIGNLTFRLYEWNNSYAESVSGTPVAQETFVNYPDNARNILAFDEQEPGEYIWTLSGGTETVGVWKFNETNGTSISFYDGQQVTGNYVSDISYDPNMVFSPLATGASLTPVRIFEGVVVETYVGGDEEIRLNDPKHTSTGYYLRKFNYHRSGINNNADGSIRLFRLAELYLNFAEAAYQSVGPDAVVTAGGFSMSARDAVNAVRERAGMPHFLAGMSPEAFGKKYRNERQIELAFEGHRFFDVRRWKILEETDEFVTGMEIVPSGPGFIYNRFQFEDRDSNTDKFLRYPIDQNEVNKIFGLTGETWQNPGW